MWHAWGRQEMFTWFRLGGPKGRVQLEGPRRRWEYNIKMGLRELGNDGENWIQLAQDKVWWRVFVNTVRNLRIP